MRALVFIVTGCFGWPDPHLYAQLQPGPAPAGHVKAHVWPQKITVRVVDEEGLPVEGAEVGIGMSDAVGFDLGYNVTAGKSDAHGRMSAEAPGDGHAEITAVKEGFYRSRLRYDWDVDIFNDYDGVSEFKVPAGYRANPWNPEVELVLVRIGDRVPLETHGVGSAGPRIVVFNGLAEEYGYDMVVGDLVKPHGEGSHVDLILKTQVEAVEGMLWNSVLEIAIAGERNGLIPLPQLPHQQSEFRFLRHAQEEGYLFRSLTRRAQVAIRVDTSDPRYFTLQRLKGSVDGFLRMEARVGAINDEANQAEAWVFRIRGELEAAGGGPIYGLLMSPINYRFIEKTDQGRVDFGMVLNPEPGNRILEQLNPELITFPPAVPEAGVSPPTPGL